MACRGCLECLLKLLNFLLTLVGLAMVGYGIYLLVEYLKVSGETLEISLAGDNGSSVELGRPMLMAVSLSSNILDKLPKAWSLAIMLNKKLPSQGGHSSLGMAGFFESYNEMVILTILFIYAFIGIGVILFVISCFGCIGAVTRNGCCLTCYSVLVILLILVELGCAAFIFFDKSWKDEIPTDKTGDFDMLYDFLKEHWKIIKWVALGAVILEALLFLLALTVRAANRPADYDNDDDIIHPRQIRQPLLTRPPPPGGVPVAGTLDQRPSRNDAWSTRMREKYGLDTSEFTYNPSESNRYPQAVAQPAEERSRCTIM